MRNTLLKQVLSPFWSICMLQKGPQDLPASGLLLAVVILLGIVLNLVNLRIVVPGTELPTLVILVIVYALTFVSSLSVLMWLMHYQQRIIQTLTALFGTGIIISLCVLPFQLMVKNTPDEPSIFSIFILALIVWSLVVTAHILRNALSSDLLIAWALTLGYLLLNVIFTNYFIPHGI